MRLADLRVAIIAAGATLAFPLSAHAQSAPPPSPAPSASPALQQIGNVVTSDRRDEPVSQSSRPTYVVNRSQIDAYGARTVYDALASVPGIELYNYGGFGSQVNYGLRGSTSEQTLVLVDGQPVTSADSGTTYLQQLSTIGVDHIEVVESGSSTLYGTSASGGVINVITSVPRTQYFSASGGSFADRDLQIAAGNGVIGGAFERHIADNNYGYPATAYNPANAYPAGTRQNAYADQTAARLLLATPIGGGFSIRARADNVSLDEGVPGSITAFEGFSNLTPSATQNLHNETGDVSIGYTAKRSTISLDVSGAKQSLTFADPSFGEDDTYTGRTQVSLKDTSSFGRADLVAGIDLSRETGLFAFPSSPTFDADGNFTGTAPPFSIGAAQSQSAAYAQVGVDASKALRVIAGVRGEHDAPQGSVLAPSFGGIVRSGAVRFTGNLGESFRVPTLNDLYYPGFSNPNLLPEKAATSDATLAADLAGGSLSAGYFSRSGSNFIVVAAPTFLPFNASRASTSGLQFTARSRALGNGIVFDASFTDLYKALDETTGLRLPETPNGSATLGLTKTARGNERFAYGLRWRIVGDDGDDASNVQPLAANYNANDSIDAFLRYKLAPRALISIRGFNLADEHNVPIYGYPAPGRRLYVELATQ